MSLQGSEVTAALEACGITHAILVPDSLLGSWQPALVRSPTIRLLSACREGEAIAIAGGLLLGGCQPLVLMQCTGLFEAGDALRNIVHDLQLPLLMVIGVRNAIAQHAGQTTDNCPLFTEPILEAWKLPHVMLDPSRASADDLGKALHHWQQRGEAGVVLIAE